MNPPPSGSRKPKLTRVMRSAPCRRSGFSSLTTRSRLIRWCANAPLAMSRVAVSNSRKLIADCGRSRIATVLPK
ncbi:Uncharacterised protein [Mycobacterium tuberculosis]|nr:Uncharacterised protein [Mycobacterium tuberculosis]